MALRLYNTLNREKQEFKPRNVRSIGFYSCGPTVYSFQHIGNLRTYIFNDLLKRVLTYDLYKVKHVMNYTDVGHLTSDADEGEDKIEKAALREKKSAKEIADYYAGIFEEDCRKLNIIAPDIVCRATEHIKEQIDLVKVLEKKGYTYKTNDGIYFDTSKVEDYGKLARLDISGLEAGKRVEMGEKRNKTDFALWKFSENPGVRQQEWNSNWGIGYPGWHIECSAMASKYLGKQFDIHTGGEDHIAVHHTNEIAQSESAFGKKPWVKFWLHGAFLTFKGEKVSKSKGGLYTLSQLQELGFEPMDFRYLCLTAHYKTPLNFSLEALEGARNTYDKLKNHIFEFRELNTSNKTKNIENYRLMFQEAIDDDLNMPEALSVMWSVIKDKELGAKESLKLMYEFDTVFGLGLKELKEDEIPEEIAALVEEREAARNARDWSKSDKLRAELHEKGYLVEDSTDGPKVRKI
jgi:cysteinyl-tRNA synthetase